MDKTKLLLFISLLLVNEKITAQQGINNNWLMGYSSWGGLPNGNTLFDFFSGTPIINYDSLEMEFNHTHANISDLLLRISLMATFFFPLIFLP